MVLLDAAEEEEASSTHSARCYRVCDRICEGLDRCNVSYCITYNVLCLVLFLGASTILARQLFLIHRVCRI